MKFLKRKCACDEVWLWEEFCWEKLEAASLEDRMHITQEWCHQGSAFCRNSQCSKGKTMQKLTDLLFNWCMYVCVVWVCAYVCCVYCKCICVCVCVLSVSMCGLCMYIGMCTCVKLIVCTIDSVLCVQYLPSSLYWLNASVILPIYASYVASSLFS